MYTGSTPFHEYEDGSALFGLGTGGAQSVQAPSAPGNPTDSSVGARFCPAAGQIVRVAHRRGKQAVCTSSSPEVGNARLGLTILRGPKDRNLFRRRQTTISAIVWLCCKQFEPLDFTLNIHGRSVVIAIFSYWREWPCASTRLFYGCVGRKTVSDSRASLTECCIRECKLSAHHLDEKPAIDDQSLAVDVGVLCEHDSRHCHVLHKWRHECGNLLGL